MYCRIARVNKGLIQIEKAVFEIKQAVSIRLNLLTCNFRHMLHTHSHTSHVKKITSLESRNKTVHANLVAKELLNCLKNALINRNVLNRDSLLELRLVCLYEWCEPVFFFVCMCVCSTDSY